MKSLLLICLALVGFNILAYNAIFAIARNASSLNLYFLDVGQGDSALIKLPGGAKMMVDGGPGKQTLASLYSSLSTTDRYIDLLILSHPQLDHFGGFIDILGRFKVGAFIYNGRDGTAAAWPALMEILKEQKIKTIILKEGDSIDYNGSHLKFLSPNSQFIKSKELNDTVLVARLDSEKSSTLFTGDIGFKKPDAESYLIKNYLEDIDVDILKVAHHGSKTSSSDAFLKAVSPRVSVISVGVRNTYGHPTKEAMNRILAIGSSSYRTDQDGTMHVSVKDGVVDVYKAR